MKINDLVQMNNDVYSKYQDPNHQIATPDGFKFIAHDIDKKTNHSAIALYNEKNETLAICHRGTETAGDWIKNNTQIALGVRETGADRAAAQFSIDTLKELKAEGKEVSRLIETGHSKGGREAQQASKEIIARGVLPNNCVECVTFNSAPIPERVKDKNIEYNHVNFRMYNENFLKSDVVSMLDNKVLGENIKFHTPNATSIVSAHRMPTITENIQANYPNVGNMEVSKLINSVQQGLPVKGLDIKPLSQATGKLVDYGVASSPYSATGAKSYFAEIETSSDKTKKLWGKGISSALIESNARQGDMIHLAKTGNDGKQNTWKAEVLQTVNQQRIEAARASGNPEALKAAQQQASKQYINTRLQQTETIQPKQQTQSDNTKIISRKTQSKGIER